MTGTYTHPAGNSEPLTGSISDSGVMTVTLNSQTISMTGNIRDDSTVTLLTRGGSADRVTLTFTK